MKYIIFILVFIISITSCTRNEETTSPEELPKLKKLAHTVGQTDISFEFEYSGDYLSKVIRTINDDILIINYEGNRPISMEMNWDTNFTFIFDNSNPDYILKAFIGDTLVSKVVHYFDGNYLCKIIDSTEHYINNFDIAWQSDNIIEIKQSKGPDHFNMEYDDKVNPLYGYYLLYHFVGLSLHHMSKNNIIKREYETSSGSSEINTEYEYNEFNQPIYYKASNLFGDTTLVSYSYY